MNTSLLYWILMLGLLAHGLWKNWPVGKENAGELAGWAIGYLLLGLLGWRVFGPALHGP